jgi:diguanylate cyclase (GGDEF)-like protein
VPAPSENAGSSVTRDDLLRLIREQGVAPRFQPIVDLFSGEVFGYEVFSRAKPPFENPRLLFEKAWEWGLSLDLDCLCRAQALKAIAEFIPRVPHKKFFLNVSPHIFEDERFQKGFTLSKLTETGLDQRRVVLEIAETSPVRDYAQFERMVRHYFEQGFSIALNHFGAGQNGLITLVASSPNYVKLDYGLISKIDTHIYKQHLVNSIRSFAANVESVVIAQGVETEAELETLIRLGVRYAQGYLLGRPEPEPLPIAKHLRDKLKRFFEMFNYPHVSNENSIINILMRPPMIEPHTTTCEQMDVFFREDPSVDHVVIVENDQPQGILTRQHFYTSVGGPFGFSVVQKRYADELAKTSPLTVNERMEITDLGRLAMTRTRDDVYEPVLVTDGAHKFLGSSTMKQLLFKFISFEIRVAADSNPLTNLPGNRIISQWIEHAMDSPPFTIIYADLDHFKEYNDVYGFAQGDRMIRLAARTLSDHFSNPAGSQEVGHIGGDDFVVICKTLVPEDDLERVCADFDERKKSLFQADDLERGYYQTETREGAIGDILLVTLSLAVLTSENIKARFDLEQVAQVAASLKKQAKQANTKTRRSGFLMDRRTYI